MTATVVLQTASRARWLKARRRGLGGTDAAAVLGMSPYASPLDVWLSKTGRGPDVDVSYAMRRGTYLEPFILAEYGRRTGAIMEKPPALLAHPDYPMILASLDGLAHHPDRTVIVDAKAPTWRGREAWWDEERMAPDHYCVQMLVYLAVTGLDEAVLAADVAGEPTDVTIMRDEAWERIALDMLAQWWAQHVVADVPPPADWARDSIPALNRAWAVAEGAAVEATDCVAGAVRAYQSLRPAHSERAKTLDRLKVQVREGMRNAQHLTINGAKVASLDKRGALRIKGADSEI